MYRFTPFLMIFTGIALSVAMSGCSADRISGNVEVVDICNFKELPWEELPEDIRSPEYIRLSPGGDGVILGGIDDIKIAGGKIYVRDWRNKRIAVFGMDGKGIRSLVKYGRGPGEYLNISAFDVDGEGNIFVIDGTSDRLLVYDRAGACTRDEKLPFEIEIIKVIDPDNYLLALCSWENGPFAGTQLMRSDSLLNKKEEISRYTEYVDSNYWLSSSYFVTSADRLFFQKQVNDSVYCFNNAGTPEKIYLFDFGHATVPPEMRRDLEKAAESGDLNRYTTLIEFTVIGNQYIYGTIREKGEPVMFIADKEARTLYKLPVRESGRYGVFRGCSNGVLISYLLPGVPGDPCPEREDDFLLALYKVK